MDKKADMTKISALYLNDNGELLIVRSSGKNYFIALGGKIEKDESHEECLRREIYEETGMKMTSSKRYLGPFVEEIMHKPGTFVEIYFYLVELEGIPQLNADDNIIEFIWLSKKEFEENKDLKIATGIKNHAIPQLIADGLMK